MTDFLPENSKSTQHSVPVLLSVVIPARDEERYIGACLDAVDSAWRYARETLNLQEVLEVIVVLDRCTDRTEEIARARGARVVRHDEKNLAAIRNAGARAAHGKYLVTVDADSFMSQTTLRHILRVLQSGRYVGGGVMILPERWSLGILCTGLCLVPIALWYRISGGLFFCERSDFEAIGGFDESLSSVEDIDFARRLKQHGKATSRRFATLLRAYIITSCRKFDRFGDWYFLKHPRETIALLKGRNQELADRVWYEFPRS